MNEIRRVTLDVASSPPSLAKGLGARQASRADGIVVEADYLVLPEGVGRPVRKQSAAEAALSAPGMEALRPGRGKPFRMFSGRGGVGFWLFGLSLAACSFWTAGGHALLSTTRAPASMLRADGRRERLSLSVQHAGIETAGGRPVLRVAAEAANTGVSESAVPPVWITVTTGKGTVLRYAVAMRLPALAAGSRQSFESTLPVPTEGVGAIGVVFADGNG